MNNRQLSLLEPDSIPVRLAYLEGRLREARTPEEQDRLLTELSELAPEAATWNGKIFVTDDDIPF